MFNKTFDIETIFFQTKDDYGQCESVSTNPFFSLRFNQLSSLSVHLFVNSCWLIPFPQFKYLFVWFFSNLCSFCCSVYVLYVSVSLSVCTPICPFPWICRVKFWCVACCRSFIALKRLKTKQDFHQQSFCFEKKGNIAVIKNKRNVHERNSFQE
jgi:hypothetical protein